MKLYKYKWFYPTMFGDKTDDIIYRNDLIILLDIVKSNSNRFNPAFKMLHKNKIKYWYTGNNPERELNLYFVELNETTKK